MEAILRLHGNDMGRTIEWVTSVMDSGSESSDLKLCQLSELFPERPLNELWLALHANGNDIEASVESLLSRQDTIQTPIEILQSLLPQIDKRLIQAALEETGDHVEGAAALLLDKKRRRKGLDSGRQIIQVASSVSTTNGEASSIPSIDETPAWLLWTFQPTEDFNLLRQRAHDVYKRRSELFNKAAAEYQRGRLTGNSAASFYSQEVLMVVNDI